MSASPSNRVTAQASDRELRDLYHALDIRRKLANGQAYIEERRVMSGPPSGDFPVGTRSRIVKIKLTVNDYDLCIAHHYVSASGEDVTEPDPKMIQLDDVTFKQG